MALGFIWNLQNLWPFYFLKFDDLRASNEIVKKLAIPEHTKQFVYAVREPETQSVIYILSAQSLSERSAFDADSLIRELKPDAVAVQVSLSPFTEKEGKLNEVGNYVDNPLPTSSFEVLRQCFVDKVTKEKYDNIAGSLLLQEIFGIGFQGQFLAAKKAAKEVGSSFLVIESTSVNSSVGDNASGEVEAVSTLPGLVSSLAPRRIGSVVPLNCKRIFLTSDIQSRMVKILSSYMNLSSMGFNTSSSFSEMGSKEIQPQHDYEVPPFAEPIYPLLVDLYNIFDLPMIGKALAHAQKMLDDLYRGEAVDGHTISEVYTFRVAVEGLRIALNSAGRLPINKIVNSNSAMIGFSELPVEEKSQVLLAQALRNQAKKFNTIVAVVDASCLVGLRKYWNYSVSPEVMDLVEQLITETGDEEKMEKHTDWMQLLTGKPGVAVGAGATAVVGVSSLSKVVPLSTVMKVVTFKVPASLKLILAQTHKTLAFAFGKSVGPSKLVARGVTSSGFKASSIMKAAGSAEKIRTVAHGIIASAEKTSISAVRTAFYEIMRKRGMRPVGFLPWATFACSITTCTGLLACGDGIECAAESLPVAPSIASLGLGIQRLQQVSKEVRQRDGIGIQKSIESLMYRLKNIKFQ